MAGRTSSPLPSTPRSGLFLVLVGGAAGAAAREAIEQAWPTSPGHFPVVTLAVNLSGAFALGLALTALRRSGPDRGWRLRSRLLLGTGFCGAYTTFSTLALETVQLGRAHHLGSACTYLVVSMLAGLAAAGAGTLLASRLVGPKVALSGPTATDPDL